MSKRRIIQERKTAKPIDYKKEIIRESRGLNSMTNWLTVLVFVLPLLFSRFTLDPAIVPRYIFLSSFILLFFIYFNFIKKINYVFTTPVKIVFAFGIAFGAWSILSLTGAINPSAGYYEIARHFLNIILLFIVFVTIQNEESQLIKICKAILIMSFIQSLVGILQYYELAFIDLPGSDPKPYGLMANRNVFGSAQALLLPFILFVLYKSQKKAWKYLSIIAAAGIIVSVLISQTRSAWLAAVVIIILSLILNIFFSPSIRKKWLVGFAISLPIVTILIGLVIITDKKGAFTESIKQRTTSLIHLSTKVSATVEEGGNERLKMWSKTTQLIKDKPLFGTGTGNWKIAIPNYDTTGIIWSTGKYVPTRPHNVYLEVASETGIPGAIIFIGMWIIISIIAFRMILKPGTEDRQITITLMISGIAAFAIDAMFSFPTERIEHSLYIYLMAGIILGSYQSHGSRIQKQRPYKILTLFLLPVAVFNIFMGYKKYNFEMHMNYAKAYEKNKNYNEELAEADAGKSNLVTISPEGMPIEIRSSIAYKELKDYKSALNEIIVAKKYNPNSTMIYNNMGTIYTEMKDFNNAIESYQHALKLSPRSDITLKNLAVNYFNTENYAACIQALNRVEEKEQDSVLLNDLLNEAKRRLSLQKK